MTLLDQKGLCPFVSVSYFTVELCPGYIDWSRSTFQMRTCRATSNRTLRVMLYPVLSSFFCGVLVWQGSSMWDELVKFWLLLSSTVMKIQVRHLTFLKKSISQNQNAHTSIFLKSYLLYFLAESYLRMWKLNLVHLLDCSQTAWVWMKKSVIAWEIHAHNH